jgi:hypothetical protein
MAAEQQDAADEVRASTMAALAADLGVIRTLEAWDCARRELLAFTAAGLTSRGVVDLRSQSCPHHHHRRRLRQPGALVGGIAYSWHPEHVWLRTINASRVSLIAGAMTAAVATGAATATRRLGLSRLLPAIALIARRGRWSCFPLSRVAGG